MGKTAKGRVLLDASPVGIETSARGIGRHVACMLPHVKASFEDRGWEVWEAGVRGTPSLLGTPSRTLSLGAGRIFRWLDPWQRQAFCSWMLPSLARSIDATLLLATEVSLLPSPTKGVRTAAMLYDLIPLLDRPTYVDRFKRGNRWLWDRRLPRRWKEADLVFTSTAEVSRTARELLDITPDRLRVVHPGVDHLAPALGSVAEIGAPFFLYVGAIESRKNIERLVQAFARFHERSGGGVKLAIAGPMAPFRRKMVETWAMDAGIPDEVLLLGRVDDARLQALYAECLAFAFPSLMEGFGLPPLEAMRAGAPVLAARASCMPEVLGEDVLWVDGLDIEDIAAALGRLASDADLRRRLADAGPRHAAGFSWSTTGNAMVEEMLRGLR